ncbi:hypothetical protein OSTOST_24066, partial [Ostertagia ostertagi]
MTPIDPTLCESITQSRKYLDVPLEQLSSSVYGSENQIHYSYPWFFGEKCTVTTNVYFEKGTVATFDGNHLIGQFGSMAHCNITKSQCNLTHGTVIWTPPPTTSICRYVKATEGVAYVTPTHIVLNNIQSAFTYKNVTFSHSQLNAWCLNNSAIPMDNGVFIVLPEIEDYHPIILFSQYPEVVDGINRKHFYNSQLLNLVTTVPQPTQNQYGTDDTLLKTAKSSAQSQNDQYKLPTDEPAIKEPHFTVPLIYRLIRNMNKRSVDNLSHSSNIPFSRKKRLATMTSGNHKSLNSLLTGTKDSILNDDQNPTHKSTSDSVTTRARHSIESSFHDYVDRQKTRLNIAFHSEPDFATINNDQTIGHEQRQDNRHAEPNTKQPKLFENLNIINFLDDLGQFVSAHEFNAEQVHKGEGRGSKIAGSGTTAARILLNREDIFALSAGDVLMVSKCKEIVVHVISLSLAHELTADINHLAFTMMETSHSVHKKNFIFNSPPIFHSDLAKISTDLYLIKNHLNSMNNLLVHCPVKIGKERVTNVRPVRTGTNGHSSISGIQRRRVSTISKGKSSRILGLAQSGQNDCHRVYLSLSSSSYRNFILPNYFVSDTVEPTLSSHSGPVSVSIQLPACINLPAAPLPMINLPAAPLPMINLPAAPDPIINPPSAPVATFHQQSASQPPIIRIPKAPPASQATKQQFSNLFPGISCVHHGNTSQMIYLLAKLNNSSIVALLDTGSALTIVSETVARKIKAQLSQPLVTKGITANGSFMDLLGQFSPHLTIGSKTIRITCYVASDANCSSPFILGNDTIQRFTKTMSINYHSHTVSFDKNTVPFTTLNYSNHDLLNLPVHLVENITLQPFSDNIVMGTTNTIFPQHWELFTSDNPLYNIPNGIHVGKTLSCPNTQGTICLRIFNSYPTQIPLQKENPIAIADFVGVEMLWEPIFSVYHNNATASGTQQIKESSEYIPPEANFAKELPHFPNNQSTEIENRVQINHSILNEKQLFDFHKLLDKYHECFVGKDGNL